MKFYQVQKIIMFVFSGLMGTMNCYSQTLFKSNQTFSIGSFAAEVQPGDINHDGLEDVVYASGPDFGSPLEYKIFVYAQTPAGTLSHTATYPYPPVYPGLRCMRISDVNNDGLKDVIIGYGDSIGIFFQNTFGTLNPIKSYYSGNTVDAVSSGDLNNDGLSDIAVCHWNVNYLRVFYQNGSGFTSSTYPKPNGGYDEIEIGDLNSDNRNDVVMVSSQNFSIHVFIQNTSGQLNSYVSYLPSTSVGSFHGVAIGDLNNDGANDLAISRGGNKPNADVLLWFQNSSGTLGTQLPLPAHDSPAAIGITDFNCDGKPEIYTVNGGFNAISVYSQDAFGSYGPYQLSFITSATHYNSSSIGAADLDNDGRKDFVSISNIYALNLTYNASKPTTFNHIQTLVQVDTVYTNSQLFNYFFVSTRTDTLGNKYVVQRDSFKVILNYTRDSVRIDTIMYRDGHICSRNYHDTLTNSNMFVYSNTKRDTLLWFSKLDTLYAGIGQLNKLSGIPQLYPNPTSGKVYLKDYQGLPTEVIAEVFDQQGKKVQSLPLKRFYDAIDLGVFVNGTYFVHLTYGDYRLVYKVVKE